MYHTMYIVEHHWGYPIDWGSQSLRCFPCANLPAAPCHDWDTTWRRAGGSHSDWIGLREILQETIDFPIKYGAFL